MSHAVAPLARKMVNEMQLVLGSMELGDYLGCLRAWQRGEKVYIEIRRELLKLLEAEHLDEVKRHKDEIEAILASTPFNPRKKKTD